jgi:hypothetical protein
MSNRGLDDEFALALNVKDGSKIWEQRIGKVGNPKQTGNYTGSRSTAIIDGDAVYVLGSDGDLACLDSATDALEESSKIGPPTLPEETTAKASSLSQATVPVNPLSALDTAAKVLSGSGRVMNCQELITAMAATGYWNGHS